MKSRVRFTLVIFTATLSPRGYMAMSERVSDCQKVGEDMLVSRDQRFC